MSVLLLYRPSPDAEWGYAGVGAKDDPLPPMAASGEYLRLDLRTLATLDTAIIRVTPRDVATRAARTLVVALRAQLGLTSLDDTQLAACAANVVDNTLTATVLTPNPADPG
jgi:hypothetical protein